MSYLEQQTKAFIQAVNNVSWISHSFGLVMTQSGYETTIRNLMASFLAGSNHKFIAEKNFKVPTLKSGKRIDIYLESKDRDIDSYAIELGHRNSSQPYESSIKKIAEDVSLAIAACPKDKIGFIHIITQLVNDPIPSGVSARFPHAPFNPYNFEKILKIAFDNASYCNTIDGVFSTNSRGEDVIGHVFVMEEPKQLLFNPDQFGPNSTKDDVEKSIGSVVNTWRDKIQNECHQERIG